MVTITLCLETILDVGPCGDFIMTDHTIDNYKEHLWKSTLFNSDVFKDSVTESSVDFNVLEKAQDIYDNAIKNYKPINITEGKLKAIEDVTNRAIINLLN